MHTCASFWIGQDGGASPGSGGTGPGQHIGQGQLSAVTHVLKVVQPGAPLQPPGSAFHTHPWAGQKLLRQHRRGVSGMLISPTGWVAATRGQAGQQEAGSGKKNVLEDLQLPMRKQKFTSTNGGPVLAVLLDSSPKGMARVMSSVFPNWQGDSASSWQTATWLALLMTSSPLARLRQCGIQGTTAP